MKRDKAAYLYDLLEACDHIENFTANHNCAQYSSDILTKRAVEREFEIIGEILRRIKSDMPDLFDQIPSAPEIIAFRNIISHGYDVVSDDRVYWIAKHKVPELHAALKSL